MKQIFRSLASFSRSRLGALVINLLLAMVLFMLARVLFVIFNWDRYSGHIDARLLSGIVTGGLRFDLATLFYLNGLYIVAYLFPFHLKEPCRPWHLGLKILYVTVNSVALLANLADCVYVRFTGRRTTATIFAEFANENNLLTILSTELFRNLHLVIIFLLAVWALWKLYRTPSLAPVASRARYYIIMLVALAVAALLAVASIRGGLDRTTRPITLSNANQYVNRPIEAAAVLNTPFSIIRSMGKPAFDIPPYMPDNVADAIYSPLHLPADSIAPFRPMNVVVLIVESFSRGFIGALNDSASVGYTPFTDELISRSLTYTHSFANGMKSIDGMPSVLSSIPMMIEPFFLTPAALNDMGGLAYYLRPLGYTSAFFHGAPNGSMGFEAFARRSGFDRYYGLDEYCRSPRHNGRADFDGAWAIWDEPFLQFFAEELTELPQPFVASVFTASSHHPFALPKEYRDTFPEEGDHPILKCIRYTDHALRRFFDTASHQPWFDNTLFVLTSDHSSHPTSPAYSTPLGQYAAPIIFYAPSDSTLRGVDTARVAQQIDILPTILDYLNYDRPYIAFGIDLFNTPPESTWAFSYNSGIYQFTLGDIFLEYDGKAPKAAYRYTVDPLLQHDILRQLPDSTVADIQSRLEAFIQQYSRAMKTNRLLPQ